MGTDSTRLGYDITGPDDAPPLVLGSSLGTSRAMWDAVLPSLASTFRVVRYEHLGHGASDVPPGPYTIDGLTAELAALLDSLGIDRAHHAGVSLGGMVAMRLAASDPERVDRLGVVCSSAHLPPPSMWDERADTARSTGTESLADTVVARWFTDAAPADVVRGAREQIVATPDEGYAGCCEAIRDMDLRPALGAITAPALVIAGAEDPATPVAHAEVITEGIRAGGGSAEVQVIDGAAHLAALETPGEVASLLQAHLVT